MMIYLRKVEKVEKKEKVSTPFSVTELVYLVLNNSIDVYQEFKSHAASKLIPLKEFNEWIARIRFNSDPALIEFLTDPRTQKVSLTKLITQIKKVNSSYGKSVSQGSSSSKKGPSH
jgi:hypothetical protein